MKKDAVHSDTGFHPLPRALSIAGEPRRVGLELEYGKLGVQHSSRIVQELFGGEVTEDSTFARLVHTDVGTFSIQIDSSILKEKKYHSYLESWGVRSGIVSSDIFERLLSELFSFVVPFEVVTPPLSIEQLAAVEQLRERMRAEGASGTRRSILNAFGLHLNVEIPPPDARYFTNVLRAFIVAYPWLRRHREIDISRRLAPYINPYPQSYAKLILPESYQPDLEGLVSDYLVHNPTRNRALDMLPCFFYLTPHLFEGKEIDGRHLVKGRPAFHYRLPNCMVDEEHWRIQDEWNAWVLVERLADNTAELSSLADEFLENDFGTVSPPSDRMSEVLERYA